MINTLVLSLPPLDACRPPLAGAIISNIFKHQGHDVTSVDLQFELNQWLSFCNLPNSYFSDVFYENNPSFSNEQKIILKKFIASIFKKFDVSSFDYIACSFFSYLAQAFGIIFLENLRPKTSAKIVIGGAGLVSFNTLANYNSLSFPEMLKSKGLIDEYITGEAEIALVDYLNNRPGPGIGNAQFKQIDNLDACLWPDYNFYNLNKYSSQQLTIIGSRGCVRKCTFCDVVKTSPKYRYRSGKNIAQEIIHHYETHGITDYYFADSLVNGSFKAFNDLCNELVKYNAPDPITWSGQYIIRSQTTTPKNHFDLLKSSGCKTLFVGIESGSDKVRKEMGKNFTNNDIEFYLENFSRLNIEILFLFFTGYVSETDTDHAETLQMFKRWQRFVADGTIKGIETLNVLTILPGSPLEQYAIDNNFSFKTSDDGTINLRSWINPLQPHFDFKERVRRHVSMMEEAIKYKWPLWNGDLSITLYEQSLLDFMNSPKKYISIQNNYHTGG